MRVCTLTHLDGIVSEPTHYLLVIILQAIDSLAVLTVTLNPGERVVSILPVSHHPLKVGTQSNTEFAVQLTSNGKLYFAYWNTHQ